MNFCKVEDSNKNLYILTDKFKQPLITHPHENKNTCFIPNGKKFLDNPELINRKNFRDLYKYSFYNDTKIPFILKNEDNNAIVNKSDIDFNIYNIATIKKDIVIKDKDDKQYTGKDIEKNFNNLFNLDRTSFNDIENLNLDLGEEIPLDVVSKHITRMYNYYQDFLIKEDITKVKSSVISEHITKMYDNYQDFLIKVTSSADMKMYIGIGIFVFFLTLFWLFKKKKIDNN
jgi:hypothetical protein